MKEYRNEAHEFFSNLSNEELKKVLEDAGFEVTDGNGEFVCTGINSIEGKVEKSYTDEGISYFTIETKDIGSQYQDEWLLDYLLSDFEGKKVRLTVEVVE